MLLWLSQATGKPNPELLFRWLEGTLGDDFYMIHNPAPTLLHNQVLRPQPRSAYDCGIGVQKTWKAFTDGTFNATGFVNWYENVMNMEPMKLFYEMNNLDGNYGESPNPLHLLYYSQNPNFIIRPDGSPGFIFHGSIGGTNDDLAKAAFWNLFNGSWWDETLGTSDQWDISNPRDTLPGRLFQRIRQLEVTQINEGKSSVNLTYNFFQMLMNLGIKPEEWLNAVEQSGVIPMRLFGTVESLNLTKQLETAKLLDKKTKLKLNGTFSLVIYGLDLNIYGSPYALSYAIDPTDYTMDYHLLNFFEQNRFSTAAGTWSIY
jgi:hypothetical protein